MNPDFAEPDLSSMEFWNFTETALPMVSGRILAKINSYVESAGISAIITLECYIQGGHPHDAHTDDRHR